jgi:hypothetical protein
MLFISLNLCQICLFEFIRVEGGVKFIKHFMGAESYKSLGTSVSRPDLRLTQPPTQWIPGFLSRG